MKVHGKNHVYEYVPDFADNRKLPAEEQIVIGLSVVPLSEFDDYQRSCLIAGRKFSVDKAQELNEKRFHAMIDGKVHFVRGLELEGHEGKEITFDVLYNEVPELAGEIIQAVKSTEQLTAGEQKNFLPESDGVSSAPAQKQKATTAKAATTGKGR